MLALNQEVDGIKVPDIKICIFGDSFPQKRFYFNNGFAYKGKYDSVIKISCGFGKEWLICLKKF